MHFSSLRAFQWLGVAIVLLIFVGLEYDFQSDAGMRMNAPNEDPLSQGLLGYWKMDEGTGTSTTADASGNANTLTMTNADAEDWQAGQIGPYMLDFNGTDEYLTVADPAILDFADGTSFSLTGWFNRDTAGSDDTIIAKKTDQSTNTGYTVWIDNNGTTDYLFFEAADDGGSTYQIQSTTDFSTTGWHHFAISWNDNSALTTPVNLYIDGTLNNGATSGTFADMGDVISANAFRIGAESGTADNFFDGKLDDIRVYGYPLSADQVLKLYQTTAPAQPVDTGLVGHWTFDGPDIQGTTAIDRSGKGTNGTRTGTTPTIGKLGQGLSFNGTSDYVDAGDIDATDGASRLTVSAWVYDTNPTSFAPIVSKYSSIDGNWNLRIAGGASHYMFFAFDFSNYGYSSDFSHEANTWEHWVAVFDGTQAGNSNRLKIYKNGELDVAGFGGTVPASTSSDSNAVRIGSRPDESYYWNGRIDDVRVYTRVLAESEVKSLFYLGR